MRWYLAFHIVGVIIWIGGLLDLTRIMGYHVKEELTVQRRLSWMEFRMYWFVATPGMVIALIMGFMIFILNGGADVYLEGQMWFAYKVLLLMMLFCVHAVFGKFLMDMRKEPRHISPARFKILHGITGLLVIAIVIFVIVKPV